jgi:hypothetical protein
MRVLSGVIRLKVCLVTWCVLCSLDTSYGQNTGVAWWRLDEAKGEFVADSSGAGNNGSLGSSPVIDPNDPLWISPGRLGPAALNFAPDQFTFVPNALSLQPSTITVQAWVRSAGLPEPFRYIVSKGALTCQSASYALYTASTGGAAFYIFDGTNFFVSPVAPAANVWNGAWHHLVGTYDGSYVRIFLDGSEVGSGTSTGGALLRYNLATSNDLLIGGYSLAGCPLSFKGDIDEVRIWNQVLTPTVISTLATKACNFVTLGVTPATVSASSGQFVTVSTKIQNCLASSQALVIAFDAATPCTKSLYGSIPVTLTPNYSQSVSFPIFIPRGACTGNYNIRATTLLNAFPVVMTSATLTVTP